MNDFLSSSFSTSVPFASVVFSILYMIYNNIGLFILSAVCASLPAIIFLCISIYIFFRYGRHATIEINLDTIQLGLIQLAIILLAINSVRIVTEIF